MILVIKNTTDLFIDTLYKIAKIDYPKSASLQAKKCILDYLGVTLAGAKMLDEKGNNLLNCFRSPAGDTTIIGFGQKSYILNAAFLNGICAHIAELDDGIRFGMFHPGAPIISALLPLAEQENLDGSSLIEGIIMGYEAATRLASAIQPFHKERGYHATGTCGVFGVAIGVAFALNFNKVQIKNAFSAAATGSSGLLKVFQDGSELKPYNAGKAAMNGLMAAMMAKAGFNGPDDILGGKNGFLELMANKYSIECLEKEGQKYGVENIYFKPYAACRHCHPAIEAVIALRLEHQIEPENIKSINVATYHWAVENHDHADIKGITSAKMSIPYSVAVALVTGEAGIDEFNANSLNNEQVLALAHKVKVCADKYLTDLVPERRVAVVEITTGSNKSFNKRIDYPKGEPENPLSIKELTDKFVTLAQYAGKPIEEIEKIIDYVWNLENDLHKLYALL